MENLYRQMQKLSSYYYTFYKHVTTRIAQTSAYYIDDYPAIALYTRYLEGQRFFTLQNRYVQYIEQDMWGTCFAGAVYVFASVKRNNYVNGILKTFLQPIGAITSTEISYG